MLVTVAVVLARRAGRAARPTRPARTAVFSTAAGREDGGVVRRPRADVAVKAGSRVEGRREVPDEVRAGASGLAAGEARERAVDVDRGELAAGVPVRRLDGEG